MNSMWDLDISGNYLLKDLILILILLSSIDVC